MLLTTRAVSLWSLLHKIQTPLCVCVCEFSWVAAGDACQTQMGAARCLAWRWKHKQRPRMQRVMQLVRLDRCICSTTTKNTHSCWKRQTEKDAQGDRQAGGREGVQRLVGRPGEADTERFVQSSRNSSAFKGTRLFDFLSDATPSSSLFLCVGVRSDYSQRSKDAHSHLRASLWPANRKQH